MDPKEPVCTAASSDILTNQPNTKATEGDAFTIQSNSQSTELKAANQVQIIATQSGTAEEDGQEQAPPETVLNESNADKIVKNGIFE